MHMCLQNQTKRSQTKPKQTKSNRTKTSHICCTKIVSIDFISTLPVEIVGTVVWPMFGQVIWTRWIFKIEHMPYILCSSMIYVQWFWLSTIISNILALIFFGHLTEQKAFKHTTILFLLILWYSGTLHWTTRTNSGFVNGAQVLGSFRLRIS